MHTRGHALALFQRQVYHDLPLPPVRRMLEDVDLSHMEAHWRGNLGVPLWHVLGDVNRVTPVWRGVWYPFNGYELR